ncbi:hypothetical protein [Pelagibius marinus]|uniref:hypothetical protein n=1 Tax=Pelagibius marinus TaxID=2762760 RepID=UPI00187287A0|nr:hypothetical protein [Pelagibius marinus]
MWRLAARLAAILAFFALNNLPALAASPAYDDPEQVLDEIFNPLLANDREPFSEKMEELFAESGRQIENLVFDGFLAEGETFEYLDLLQEEALGNTFRRYLYVLRTSTEDFLFIRVSLGKASRGWVAFDLDIKSELSKLLPDWDDP